MMKGQWRTWALGLGILCAAALLRPAAGGAQDDMDRLKAELEAQKQRQAELEDKINRLEESQKRKEESLREEMVGVKEAEPKPAATDFRVYWRDGLRFATADDMFQMRIGGRFMFDWVWMSESDKIKEDFGRQEDGVRLRRGRFYIGGNIHENIDFMLQIDFAGGEVALRDAYLGLSDLPVAKFRIGQFKEPFSLEELTSSNNITFLERGLPNAFAPSRNVGFMLHNSQFEARMTWAVGLFRDTDDTGFGVRDGTYSVTGRLTGLPWYQDKGARMLHLGMAYSHRDPDDTVQYRARPEASIGSRFVDTGNIATDQVDLMGAEAACVVGPFSLQGEFIMAWVDVAEASTADLSGYYAQVSYFLTGERRPYSTSSGTFGSIKPKNNFFFGRGLGAWELKARYSSLDLTDGAVGGGKLSNVSAGVNWYLNPNARIMWDYVHSDVDKSGNANLAMMRLHVFF